jgi:transcriptional regulator with XRE-family HTH domain
VNQSAINRCGEMLRQWRKARRVSQLDLAMQSQTSQRHLSFVETGRAQPARELILKLSETLDVPLRARNEILLAAGYAPHFPERALAVAEMVRISSILERMLEHHEPYPATVVDGDWNIVMRNRTAARIIASCVSQEALEQITARGKLNFMRLMFALSGLRPHIRSWPQTGRALLGRLRREASSSPGSPSEALLRDMEKAEELPEITDYGAVPLEPVIPMAIEVNGQLLKFLTTLTTFGTPQDVTLQELRIEMSFPADDATERLLRLQ